MSLRKKFLIVISDLRRKKARPAVFFWWTNNKLGLTARKCVLEELGHRIATAANGADALEQFSNAKFDLVVTDYKMPRMDGLEFIVRLRKIAPECPVILISGFVDALGG